MKKEMVMMKLDVPFTAYAEETVGILGRIGCLLVSGNIEKANVMTIGWGLAGRFWGRPFFLVAVRPSRYTHRFIEETKDFTVNVPRKGMEEIVSYCGSVSGREHNKFEEKRLTLTPGRKVSAPSIPECVIHYECKVSYRTNVVPSALSDDILRGSYRSGNYHTLYFGEILATYADEDAKKLLPI
ncbi:MAG: flavin reductase family protein [Candidatus Bathyarchaeia archaeon]